MENVVSDIQNVLANGSMVASSKKCCQLPKNNGKIVKYYKYNELSINQSIKNRSEERMI